jgi:TRAP-type C4-dicarboxylate transport system permease small subunit
LVDPVDIPPEDEYVADIRLDRFSVFLSDAAGYLAALSIIGMTALVAANTLFRAMPGVASFTFAEEYTGYLFIAIAFLGLADTFRHGDHVRVTMVLNRFSAHRRAQIEVIMAIVAILVILVIAWFGAQFFWDGIVTGETAQTVVQTPLWIPRFLIPLGSGIFIIVLISYLRANLGPMRSRKG